MAERHPLARAGEDRSRARRPRRRRAGWRSRSRPSARAPVTPSRPRSAASARLTRRPAAAASPSISAVPEGASTLPRWCISTISMSYSGPRTAATRRASTVRRFTPTLMLPARTITACRAAAASRSRCVALEPGGADHVHQPRLRRELGMEHRRLGRGEVEHRLAAGEDLERVVLDEDAERRRRPSPRRGRGRSRGGPAARWRR